MVRNLWMYVALGWMPKSGQDKIVVLAIERSKGIEQPASVSQRGSVGIRRGAASKLSQWTLW
jgi:hypothetical protein